MIRKTRSQAVLIRDGHILMVRHFDLFIGKEYWCLPGGGVEAGESPEHAAIRELREETGLQVKVVARLHEEVFPKVYHGYARTFTFLAEQTGGILQLGYDPEYEEFNVKFLQEVRWLPIEGELFECLDSMFFRSMRRYPSIDKLITSNVK